MCWKPEKCKDLSAFDKGQIVMARLLDQRIPENRLVGVVPVCGGKYLPKVILGRATTKQATRSLASKAG